MLQQQLFFFFLLIIDGIFQLNRGQRKAVAVVEEVFPSGWQEFS